MKYLILFVLRSFTLKRTLFCFMALYSLSVSAQQPADSAQIRTKQKADDIYQRLKAGQSFELLALKYSDSLDLQRGQTENMLGYFNSTLQSAMLKLAIGQVSEPIKYGSGYYIVRVDQVSGNNYKVHLITLKFKK